MENKKIVRFVESFAMLPIITILLPGGTILNQNSLDKLNTPKIAFFEQKNIEPLNLFVFNQTISDEEKEAQIKQRKAEAIDSYFESRNMPLSGYGMKMIEEAEKNNLDWRLIPAISVIETTGGKFMCKNPKAPNNPFGWGSCKFGFESIDIAIETIAKNLGGNNPKTAKFYAGKDIEGILKSYNPPSVVPDYSTKVMKVMELIGEKDVLFDIQDKLEV